jgi:hypothetical protein
MSTRKICSVASPTRKDEQTRQAQKQEEEETQVGELRAAVRAVGGKSARVRTGCERGADGADAADGHRGEMAEWHGNGPRQLPQPAAATQPVGTRRRSEISTW